VGLEITESCLCKDIAELVEKLSMIREAGITVLIDDFGTGYCSLSYLKDLPVDYLKIDRSFIMGIEKSDKQVKLLRGITNVAKSLGVEIIAEGIETEDQLDAVIGCGCRNIQGFYISRPMNEINTLDFINSYMGPGK
jgi:EAL domain-containing protein (putative c-di-GMP-specific phosphodiesterase class I)